MNNTQKFKRFDIYLQGMKIDAMDWSDGGNYDTAEAYLEGFSAADWSELAMQWSKRPANWRTCLASLLRPQQGPTAERLLLEMVRDGNNAVAFRALVQVTLYCGVIGSGTVPGVTINAKLRAPHFLALASKEPFLSRHIERISAISAEPFRRQFRLLLDALYKPA